MTAVTDASPVCYLILIGEIEILPQLLDRILLPREVLAELLASGAPRNVRGWAAVDAPSGGFRTEQHRAAHRILNRHD